MYLLWFFEGIHKKRITPAMNKIRIKPVNHASFVSHLCFAPPVENVHNVALNLTVQGTSERFLANMGLQGCKPESSVHSEK